MGLGADDQHDRGGLRRRSGRRTARRRSTTCWPATTAPWPGRSPPSRSAPAARTCSTGSARRPGAPPRRCSASPAPAARASRRSPTSWSAASGSTRRTSSGSRCWPSTRPGAAAAGALLGDRIRMNAIEPPQVFFRSMATRGQHRGARGARRRHRRVPGGRVRPRDRRDARASARATPGSSTTATCRCT